MAEVEARLGAALEGRYRIERELGQGGMATVYLAEDLKHDRKVALKVLKPELAAVVGAERFLAEIRTTANLQHPHILPLFDSGTADGFLYYVMPYIAGESLRDRLDREKQLPVGDAVAIAQKVAGALQKAHDAGVIHRDIKPANILLSGGEPLVADFGIALAVQEAGGGRLTETGLSLGTPYYMSPEQATGDRDPDARSDLYSLACVTYEMLAGEPPFTGSTAQSVLAKILTGEAPPVTRVRTSVPLNVASAVARATQRLPADRFSTAGEFAEALSDLSYRFGAVGEAGAVGGEANGGTAKPWKVAAGVLGVACLLLAGLLVGRGGGEGPARRPLALTVAFPDSQRVVPADDAMSFSLSSDGSVLVYLGPGDEGGTRLWVKPRESESGNPLRGTEDPIVFAVSPDGSEVAFVSQSGPALQVLPTGGGTPRTLADSALGIGLDWGEDGYLYFQNFHSGLSRVPAVGGNVEELTDPTRELEEGQGDHAWPDLLPGGDKLLFTRWGNSPNTDSIAVMDLETREYRMLVVGLDARYLDPGWIVVGTVDGALSVAPFDARAGELTGPFRTIAGNVRGIFSGARDFAVSASGSLLYLTGDANRSRPAWVDMEGNETLIDPDWEGSFGALALSPDGTRIAVALSNDGRPDLWVRQLDQAGSPPQRITFQEGDVQRPFWLPGGDTVAYIASRTGPDATEVLARAWDGTGGIRVLLGLNQLGTAKILQEADISSDGRWLAYRVGGGVGTRDIYFIDLENDSVGHPLIAEVFNEHSPDISPNGRFIAYGSNESGRDEVYVRTFPDVSGGKWLISTRGAREPVWSPDGATLYYRELTGGMVAARWDREGPGGVLARQPLFNAAGYHRDPVHATYTTHPDRNRLLMLDLVQTETSRMVWIEDFAAGLGGAG